MSVWWESPGGLGFLPGFTCRILPKDVLSFFHIPLQPGDTSFHKMICIVTTSPQVWHLQLQRPGAWRYFHHSFLLTINRRQWEAWQAAVHGVAKSRKGLSS